MESEKLHFNEYLTEGIEKVIDSDFHPNNYKQLREWKAAIIADCIINRKENAEKYLQFAERVKNEPYFRLHHIDELNLPYDILIFISEKNIGKTRQMITQMDNTFNENNKFVLMRTLNDELNKGLTNSLYEAHSNFILATNGNIYRKYDDDTKTKKHCGIAMALSTCVNWKGGSFDNYKWIWFDEATDEHKDIGVAHFNKFFISVANSIERRKKDFKIIITGNTDFTVSHPLFECFEIDPDQNLIYTTRKAPGAVNETKILYINSRGLYGQGAKSSKFIGAGGDPKAALDAFMNRATKTTDRLVAIDLTYLANPFMCIVYTDSMGEKMQLVISKYKYKIEADGINTLEDKQSTWHYIKIEKFNPTYLYGYKCFTDDITIHALYRTFMKFKLNLDSEWIYIKRIIRSGKVIFVKKQTEVELYKILEKNTKHLKPILG